MFDIAVNNSPSLDLWLVKRSLAALFSSLFIRIPFPTFDTKSTAEVQHEKTCSSLQCKFFQGT